MRFPIIFLLLITIISTAHSQFTVETVPNTRLINNSHVSNPDQLLSDQAVATINLLLDSLEKKTSAQVAVVMLNSIGDADIFDFAQSLFVKWGIGKSRTDNGLLILYVQDKRSVRFHTGYGLEGDLPDAICKRIQTQKMVPRFKEGDIDGGMIAGVEEVVNILTHDNNSTDELFSTDNEMEVTDLGGISFMAAIVWLIGGPFYFFRKHKAGFVNSKNYISAGPDTTMTKGNWWLWYYILPVILLVVITYVGNMVIFFGSLYLFILVLTVAKYIRLNKSADAWLKKGEHHAVYEFYQQNKAVLALPFLFPIPFAFLMGHFKKKKLAARNHPRPCKKCKQLIQAPMSEATEDEFLSTETIFEETLKSVDYDVWKCDHCGDFHYEMYINPKTKFTQCPKCSTYALYTAGSSTKVAATTSSSGIMEVVKQCKYCNKKTIVEEYIPMISTSSDSSSSSSSDSGGSWGGGDSGGGGASSSW
jgi:uncharacterized protein